LLPQAEHEPQPHEGSQLQLASQPQPGSPHPPQPSQHGDWQQVPSGRVHAQIGGPPGSQQFHVWPANCRPFMPQQLPQPHDGSQPQLASQPHADSHPQLVSQAQPHSLPHPPENNPQRMPKKSQRSYA
jgi:hypothetical protein